MRHLIYQAIYTTDVKPLNGLPGSNETFQQNSSHSLMDDGMCEQDFYYDLIIVFITSFWPFILRKCVSSLYIAIATNSITFVWKIPFFLSKSAKQQDKMCFDIKNMCAMNMKNKTKNKRRNSGLFFCIHCQQSNNSRKSLFIH